MRKFYTTQILMNSEHGKIAFTPAHWFHSPNGHGRGPGPDPRAGTWILGQVLAGTPWFEPLLPLPKGHASSCWLAVYAELWLSIECWYRARAPWQLGQMPACHERFKIPYLCMDLMVFCTQINLSLDSIFHAFFFNNLHICKGLIWLKRLFWCRPDWSGIGIKGMFPTQIPLWNTCQISRAGKEATAGGQILDRGAYLRWKVSKSMEVSWLLVFCLKHLMWICSWLLGCNISLWPYLPSCFTFQDARIVGQGLA